MSGDSAGGNLSMALLLYLRDEVIAGRQPSNIGGGICLSPWSDFTSSSASLDSNQKTDYLSFTRGGSTKMNPAHLFLGHEKHAELVAHPYVTVAAADLSGLPPLLIQIGGGEGLRDECVLLAQRAETAGVNVTAEIYDESFHVFQGNHLVLID